MQKNKRCVQELRKLQRMRKYKGHRAQIVPFRSIWKQYAKCKTELQLKM